VRPSRVIGSTAGHAPVRLVTLAGQRIGLFSAPEAFDDSNDEFGEQFDRFIGFTPIDVRPAFSTAAS